jgi:hypothetical protein
MKIRKISVRGVEIPAAGLEPGGRYYCLSHGESGRGRWEVRLPLAQREFPVQGQELVLDEEYKLISLGKKDARGNDLYLLARGHDDGLWLILWYLDPGFRGGASFNAQGNARVIALGEEAQGLAGRMGGAPCPVVLVDGPCRLEWRRTGRLYGDPASWVAEYDGVEWHVGPVEECLLEQAALSY